MIDFLIVGAGLAGISFAETVLNNKNTVLFFDDCSQCSSKIAGGLYNPVILKRFTEVWKAKEQLELMDDFYPSLEIKLGIKVDFKVPILRKFFSIEEQNNWYIASDKPKLTPFLSTNLIRKRYNAIDSPYDFGEVLNTGYVDTLKLLNGYHSYLRERNWLVEDSFDYSLLTVNDDFVQYKDFKARHIVFAEGFGLKSNPYFNYLPLDGTKGELLIIKAPELDLDVIVNTSVFILPLGDNLYKVGATYNWKDKTSMPTEDGKIELVARIKEILMCDFEIVDHFGGVRPTVRDRRPLVGTHAILKNVHLLNGLGTRGVMLGPSLAKALYDSIENNIPLDSEIDFNRIKK